MKANSTAATAQRPVHAMRRLFSVAECSAVSSALSKSPGATLNETIIALWCRAATRPENSITEFQYSCSFTCSNTCVIADPSSRAYLASTASLSPEAVAVLAKVLAGPASQRYRVTSHSRPGVSYVLELDGPDVVCSCPGFEYRGACSHARELKAALKKGTVPSGYVQEG